MYCTLELDLLNSAEPEEETIDWLGILRDGEQSPTPLGSESDLSGQRKLEYKEEMGGGRVFLELVIFSLLFVLIDPHLPNPFHPH